MKSSMYVNIGIPIFSAILGFAGALLGTYIASERSEELWQKQERMIQLKAILNKRVELIERVSKLANSAPKMAGYQSYVDLQGTLATKYIECTNLKASNCTQPDNPKDILEISVMRAEMNAEFSSTIQLVSLYFYGETKDLANELGAIKKWWVTGEPAFRNLIKSMQDELEYFE